MGYVGCGLWLIRTKLRLKNTPQKKSNGVIITLTWDDHAAKSLKQIVNFGISCVTRESILLKRHVFGIHFNLFNPKEVNIDQPIAFTVDGEGLADVNKQVFNRYTNFLCFLRNVNFWVKLVKGSIKQNY